MCAISEDQKKSLNMSDLNPNVKLMEYAVRGPLVIRAGQIEKELEQVRTHLIGCSSSIMRQH